MPVTDQIQQEQQKPVAHHLLFAHSSIRGEHGVYGYVVHVSSFGSRVSATIRRIVLVQKEREKNEANVQTAYIAERKKNLTL